MSEPWERYQELLKKQGKVIQRSDFMLDSDSSESSDAADNFEIGYGDDPQPSTSGTQRNLDNPQPSTSGTQRNLDDPQPSTSTFAEDGNSDSEISDLSSSFGDDEPALQHFHEVTKNLNENFLPVTSLQMPAPKRKTSSPNPNEPEKKRKKLHDDVMGIGVHVIRTHHRQEKKFGFLVSS